MSATTVPAPQQSTVPVVPATLDEIRRQLGWDLIPQARGIDDLFRGARL